MADPTTILPVITYITDANGVQLRPAQDLRLGEGFVVTYNPNTNNGEPFIGVNLAGGFFTSITGTAPIHVSAGLSPVVSIDVATTTTRGTMSPQDKTKLNGIGAGATVTEVDVSGGALTFAGGSTTAHPNIALYPAGNATNGYFAMEDWTTLHAATALNAANTLMRREASTGNFAAGSASLDGALNIVGSINLTEYTATYASTIALDGDRGGHQHVALTGDVTFTAPVNFGNAPSLKLFITQAGAGSKLATFASGVGGFYFLNGLSGTLLASSVGHADYFEFVKRRTPTDHWVCVAHGYYPPP